MKKIFLSLVLLCMVVSAGLGQTKISQKFDVQSFDELDLVFEYPQLVQIKTWKGSEVKVEGMVNIADGEYDDEFKIRSNSSKGTLTIESKIKNLDKISRGATYWDNGKSDENRTMRKDGDNDSYINGMRVSIQLVITIPETMKVALDARYGMVEVLNSPAELNIDARYGGVDVKVDESELLQLDATTQWGQIYSDLQIPLKMRGDDGMGKWMTAKASLDRGENSLYIASQYGNVYLRKN